MFDFCVLNGKVLTVEVASYRIKVTWYYPPSGVALMDVTYAGETMVF